MSKQQIPDCENVHDFVRRSTSSGRAAMVANFDAIRKQERHKNRFSNVVLFNEGAVNLEPVVKGDTTYIHATRIKSKYGNYLLAQGPMSNTLTEWYRMIWQFKINVIVCLTPMENNEDCYKYFEKKVNKKVKTKRFIMRTFALRKEGEIDMYELRLKNLDTKVDNERAVHIVHYKKWQLARPVDARELLNVIRSTWALEMSMGKLTADSTDSSDHITLVHGSSGVRRTGTYVVAAMLCKQISEKGQVSIITAASSVRKYRYGVMRNKLMFTTLLECVLHFSADQGLVDRRSASFPAAIKNIRDTLLGRLQKDEEEEED